MFKFFKKDSEEAQNKGLIRGSLYGLGGALIIVIIVLIVIFGPSIWGKNKAGVNVNTPPDASAAKIRITIITKKDCPDCFDINLLTDAIKQNQADITGQETLYLGDKKTDQLVQKYKITKVPTMLVAGELDKNANLQGLWQNLGEVVDGVFVFRQVIPPYIDVASGQLKGKVSLILLSDNSCQECYDVKLHEVALKNLGLEPKDTKTVDISSDEGKALVKKYKIDKAPTLLLNGEVSEYANLIQIWPTYGRVTDDQTYIFTKLEVMGTYKDLTKNKVVVVEPVQQQAPPAQ